MSGNESLLDDRPIAALYVTKGGAYFDLPGVDPWDEERDARLYDGPYPVVAHPPCARWSRLAGFTESGSGSSAATMEAASRPLSPPCIASAASSSTRRTRMRGRRLACRVRSPVRAGRSAWKAVRPAMSSRAATASPSRRRRGSTRSASSSPTFRWGYVSDGDGDGGGGMDAWRDRFGGRRAAWEESLESRINEDGVRCRPSHLGQHSTTPDIFRDELIAMARSARVTSEAAA